MIVNETNTKKRYAEKLLDPRWQKKRLEIFNRDGFSCKYCDDKDSTLHIHHLKYSGDPWEANNDDLVTVCNYCHKVAEALKRDFPEATTQIISAHKRIKDQSVVWQIVVLFSIGGARGFCIYNYNDRGPSLLFACPFDNLKDVLNKLELKST